jgi:hypothetical protein
MYQLSTMFLRRLLFLIFSNDSFDMFNTLLPLATNYSKGNKKFGSQSASNELSCVTPDSINVAS